MGFRDWCINNGDNIKIIEKARNLEKRLDAKKAKYSNITARTYFQFTTLIFFLTGIGLFMYCLLCGHNILTINYLFCPLTYLFIGFTQMVGFFIKRKDR